MIILYTTQEYEAARHKTLLPLQCERCNKPFFRTKARINSIIHQLDKNPNFPHKLKYCSKVCSYEGKVTSAIVPCTYCGKMITKSLCYIKRQKNQFCSMSCSATYNNTHKTKGCCRSKLEAWLEGQLRELYPTVEMHFNRKDAINAELDIYIPHLKLAFELNGIFHYEPIYGEKKLLSTQNNDKRKFQACLERGIELCIIDSSKQTYVKPKSSQKYLDIITTIIKDKEKAVQMVAPEQLELDQNLVRLETFEPIMMQKIKLNEGVKVAD